jgi:hypothetical protein
MSSSLRADSGIEVKTRADACCVLPHPARVRTGDRAQNHTRQSRAICRAIGRARARVTSQQSIFEL